MKKRFKILVLPLIIVASLSSCSSTEKFIEKGYTYNLTDEPAALHKVWMPRYIRYHKKQKRYKFFDGHYRIVFGGKAWTHRQARLRNRLGHL